VALRLGKNRCRAARQAKGTPPLTSTGGALFYCPKDVTRDDQKLLSQKNNTSKKSFLGVKKKRGGYWLKQALLERKKREISTTIE